MFYLSILIIIISIILFIQSNKKFKQANEIKISKTKELEEKQRLQKENFELQEKNQQLSANQTELLLNISKEKEKINDLFEKEKNKMSEQLDVFKSNLDYARNEYLKILEQDYADKECEIAELIKQTYSKKEMAEADLLRIKDTLNAATEAQLREREKREQLDFYKLAITKDEMNDIQLLESIKPRLKQPRALCMLIWSTYFQKQTTDMCNRVLKMKNPTGVYKITNINTNQVYIGQAIKVADRWKEHIKCGLGIDTPVTNKLYKAMMQDGVYNFTFEFLEECSKDRLNEVEKFWIEMYQSNKTGYNSTKGNK